jgi:hypothetical protein
MLRTSFYLKPNPVELVSDVEVSVSDEVEADVEEVRVVFQHRNGQSPKLKKINGKLSNLGTSTVDIHYESSLFL